MPSYCSYVSTIRDQEDVERRYHDLHYGVRIEDDNELFGRLLMEINQAGLSWRTILNKETGFRTAYHNFNVRKIADYDESIVQKLLQDESIIRNTLKIRAAIHNAQEVLRIQKELGSFRAWLDLQQHALGTDTDAWVKLFRRHFTFVGTEIVGEFLKSIAMLPGAHDKKCGTRGDVIK